MLTYRSSRAVNFCVWVLQQSGREVPPFVKRTSETLDSSLADLKVESWHAWLIRLVALQDSRFGWQGLVGRQSDQSERQAYYRWQETQYHRFIADLERCGLSDLEEVVGSAEPPSLWWGAPFLQSVLAQKWTDYRGGSGLIDKSHLPDLQPLYRVLSDQYPDLLALQVYVIEACLETAYLVAPVPCSFRWSGAMIWTGCRIRS